MNPSTRRRKRLVAAGVVAVSLSVAGTGAAMAANGARAGSVEEAATPDPVVEEAATPDPVVESAPVDVPPSAPEEVYDALWDAGYTIEDVDALATLWGIDPMDAKARTGQMLLDGEPVPVAPGSTPSYFPESDEYEAFWAAGYTYDDLLALGALWGLEESDAKARAGQALIDGETLPIAPGSSVTS